MNTLTQRQKTTCRNFPHWILSGKPAHKITHTNPPKIALKKSKTKLLKRMCLGEIKFIFWTEWKCCFSGKFFITCFVSLVPEPCCYRTWNVSVSSAPGCQAVIMHPSVGTLNNVTRHENSINFPERGNRRDTSPSLSSLFLPICMN